MMQAVPLTWTPFKTLKTAASLTIYGTTLTNGSLKYRLWLVSPLAVYECLLPSSGADTTDFETNFLGASVAAESKDHAQALNEVARRLPVRPFDADGNAAFVRRNTAPAATQGVTPFGLFDGTNMQFARGDSAGRIFNRQVDVNGQSIAMAPNAAVPGSPFIIPVGGTDGANVRFVPVVVDGQGNHSPFTGVSMAATDGTTMRVLKVDPSGNLQVSQSVNPTATVWKIGNLTTSNQTANQVVVTYTVPAGKSFYISSYCINRLSNNNVNSIPARLRVIPGGTGTPIVFGEHNLTAGNSLFAQHESIFPTAVSIASATDVVQIVVTPDSNTNTNWFGRITGVLQ